MNEHIKQLLNEATSGIVQEHDKSKVMTVSDKEMEVFAELIIKECAAAVAKANNPLGRNIDKVFEMHFRGKK